LRWLSAPLALVQRLEFHGRHRRAGDQPGGLAAAPITLWATGAWWWLAWALLAAAGFLPFNLPRARIFLGDVGSGPWDSRSVRLAATLAGTPLPGRGCCCCPVGGLLVDAGLTLGRGLVRGERWWTPHVEHVYQCFPAPWPATGRSPPFMRYGPRVHVNGRDVKRDFSFTSISISLPAWYASGAALWLLWQRRAQSIAGQGEQGMGLARSVGQQPAPLAVVAHDLAMVWLCWVGLHQFRYSLLPDPPALPLWSTEMPIVLLAQGLVFWWTGLYRGMWRFASLPDLWNIVKACVLGALAIALALFLYNRLELVPRTVLALYPLVLTGSARHAAPAVPGFWKDSR
jgi:hypothetical protein